MRIDKKIFFWSGLTAVAIAGAMLGACIRSGSGHDWTRLFGYHPPKGDAYGSIAGVAVKIPHKEVFILTYRSPKDGQLPPPPHTCHTPIYSALLFLRWPTLEPRTRENNDDFIRTKWKSAGDSQWMDVGFDSAHLRSPSSERASNYLWRLRSLRLFLPPSKPVITLPAGMRLRYHERDATTGLPYAQPAGPLSGQNGLWNQQVFWDGLNESDHTVQTLITCATGTYEPPRWTPRCEHQFHIEALKADVMVAYPHNLLPQWRAIETAVRRHLLDFKTPCP